MQVNTRNVSQELGALLRAHRFVPRDGAYLEGQSVAIEFVPAPLGHSDCGDVKVRLFPGGRYDPVQLQLAQGTPSGLTLTRRISTDTQGRGTLKHVLMDETCCVQVQPSTAASDRGDEGEAEAARRAPGVGTREERAPSVLVWHVDRGQPILLPRGTRPPGMPTGEASTSGTPLGRRGPTSDSRSPAETAEAFALSAQSSDADAESRRAKPLSLPTGDPRFETILEPDRRGRAMITVVTRDPELARVTVSCALNDEEPRSAPFAREYGEWRAVLVFPCAAEAVRSCKLQV